MNAKYVQKKTVIYVFGVCVCVCVCDILINLYIQKEIIYYTQAGREIGKEM